MTVITGAHKEKPGAWPGSLAGLPQHLNDCKKSPSQVGRHWPALPMVSQFKPLRLQVTLFPVVGAAAGGGNDGSNDGGN